MDVEIRGLPAVRDSNGWLTFDLPVPDDDTENAADLSLEFLPSVPSPTAPALARAFSAKLEVSSDGQISLSLRKAWRDRTKAFVMTPNELLARLAAVVRYRREHQLTYQGVLAPALPPRDQLVPRLVKLKTADATNDSYLKCPAKQSSSQNYLPRAEL